MSRVESYDLSSHISDPSANNYRRGAEAAKGSNHAWGKRATKEYRRYEAEDEDDEEEGTREESSSLLSRLLVLLCAILLCGFIFWQFAGHAPAQEDNTHAHLITPVPTIPGGVITPLHTQVLTQEQQAADTNSHAHQDESTTHETHHATNEKEDNSFFPRFRRISSNIVHQAWSQIDRLKDKIKHLTDLIGIKRRSDTQHEKNLEKEKQLDHQLQIPHEGDSSPSPHRLQQLAHDTMHMLARDNHQLHTSHILPGEDEIHKGIYRPDVNAGEQLANFAQGNGWVDIFRQQLQAFLGVLRQNYPYPQYYYLFNVKKTPRPQRMTAAYVLNPFYVQIAIDYKRIFRETEGENVEKAIHNWRNDWKDILQKHSKFKTKLVQVWKDRKFIYNHMKQLLIESSKQTNSKVHQDFSRLHEQGEPLFLVTFPSPPSLNQSPWHDEQIDEHHSGQKNIFELGGSHPHLHLPAEHLPRPDAPLHKHARPFLPHADVPGTVKGTRGRVRRRWTPHRRVRSKSGRRHARRQRRKDHSEMTSQVDAERSNLWSKHISSASSTINLQVLSDLRNLQKNIFLPNPSSPLSYANFSALRSEILGPFPPLTNAVASPTTLLPTLFISVSLPDLYYDAFHDHLMAQKEIRRRETTAEHESLATPAHEATHNHTQLVHLASEYKSILTSMQSQLETYVKSNMKLYPHLVVTSSNPPSLAFKVTVCDFDHINLSVQHSESIKLESKMKLQGLLDIYHHLHHESHPAIHHISPEEREKMMAEERKREEEQDKHIQQLIDAELSKPLEGLPEEQSQHSAEPHTAHIEQHTETHSNPTDHSANKPHDEHNHAQKLHTISPHAPAHILQGHSTDHLEGKKSTIHPEHNQPDSHKK